MVALPLELVWNTVSRPFPEWQFWNMHSNPTLRVRLPLLDYINLRSPNLSWNAGPADPYLVITSPK